MTRNTTRTRAVMAAVALATVSFGLVAADASANPAFARKYQTSCATCHVAYPKLNAFGEAFRLKGYRMPGDDQALAKEADIAMGAEAWKRLWPKAIWPGAIPGGFPFGVLIPSQLNMVEGAEVKTDLAFPNAVELLGGGTLGEGFGYYAGVTLVEGNEFGGLHRLFGQFDSMKGTTLLNVRFGYMEPRAVPFSSHRRLTLSNYLVNAVGFDITTMHGSEPADDHGEGDGHEVMPAHGLAVEDALGPRLLAFGGSGHGHGNGDLFSFANSQRGVELWGATSGGAGGGFEYGVGVVNGNGLGSGDESFDNNSFKDLYWRAAYKFGGMGVTGTTANGAVEATQTRNWVDNSLRLGTFGYYGRSPFRLNRSVLMHDGEPIHDEHDAHEMVEAGLHLETVDQLFEADETFTRVGVDFDARLGNLNLFGALMQGQNDRREFDGRVGTDFTTWFVQGDYVFLPWVIGALKYETVNLPAGFRDIETLVPHLTLLLRANVKLAVYRRAVFVWTVHNFQKTHPPRKFGHVANKDIARFDPVRRVELPLPEPSHRLVGPPERFVDSGP